MCKKSNNKWLKKTYWEEARYDIDVIVKPDIVGSIVDMKEVSSPSFATVSSSHNIEHLYPHEVELALSEFHRVLQNDSFFIVAYPDLQSACCLIAKN